MTVDGFPVQVRVTGPEKGPHVVVLGAAQHPPVSYDSLCERLHIAAVRTVVIGADPRLHPKAVLAILDTLEVPWAVLVGDRFGAELAWELAAARPDRFTGLVVIDRGHPRVPDPHGVVHDPDCPPVEINTTALFTTPAARGWPRPASATSTATTGWSSSPPGATPPWGPRNWPPRSCCAPAVGEALR